VCPSFHGWTVISDQVARLYQAVLGRSVDQAGHLHWTIARLEGASARTLADLLLTSTERANRNGTLSDAAFVDQLYLDALGRAAESGGKAFWVAQLGGGLSRSVVALAVSDSAESATRTGTTTLMGDSEALVCRYYRMLYDRSPETGGLAHWSGLLEGGATAEQLATALLSGPEAGALTQLSMADYVGHLYQKGALNRNADAGGRDYWAGLGQQNGRAWLASQLASQLESIPT
jgi:hypothetical protein